MQRSLIALFRIINPVFLYPVVCLWVIGYIVGSRAARRGSYYYWRHRLGYSALTASFMLYLHFVEFGKAILDRFAAWAGRKVSIEIIGQELLDDLLSRSTGFIVLSSHIGNQELAGYNCSMSKTMHVLTYLGDSETVNSNRKEAFAKMGLQIIPYEKDGSHIFAMHNVLEKGEVLSVHGDRMFYGGRTLHADLLGESAAFPEGCFRVAAMEQVPVISLYMMRRSPDHYVLYVLPLSDGHYTVDNHKEQAQELLDSYVREMQRIIRLYPKQWFHFYEFWKQ